MAERQEGPRRGPFDSDWHGSKRAISGRWRKLGDGLLRAPAWLADSGAMHPLRMRHAVTLGGGHPEAAHPLDDLRVLGPLGNGLLAGQVAARVDRADHLAVDRVVQHALDEAPIDLQEVDREVLEVAE